MILGFGWQSPREGVLIKILVLVQPKIHNSSNSVLIPNKNIPNNGVNEAGTPCEGLSPGSLRMQGQVPGSHNQATTNKTPLNADNEDNVMVLGGEEWENLFGNTMEITHFNGFSCESSNEDDIDINCRNKERQTWTKILNTAVM